MFSVSLPFRKEDSSLVNQQQGVQSNRVHLRKCRTLLLPKKPQNALHPFHFQSLYFKQFAGLTMLSEAYENTMKVKYISLREGFSFPEFLQICANEQLLFEDELLSFRQLKQFEQSSDTISQHSQVSLLNQSTISKLNEGKSEYVPQLNLKKFVGKLAQEKRTFQEIQEATNSLVKVIKETQNKRNSTQSLNNNNMRLSQEKSLPTYKLPRFSSKGFLACPSELRREIIEFQESNSDKPYPGVTLSLAYFYGIANRIQKNQQLGFKYLEKITKQYPYFALAQAIQAGLKNGDSIEAEAIEFLLKGTLLNSSIQETEMNYLFDDDLPFFFENQQLTSAPKLFSSLDQLDSPIDKLFGLSNRIETTEIKELFKFFIKLLEKTLSNDNSCGDDASHPNLKIQSSLNPIYPTHALFAQSVRASIIASKPSPSLSELDIWMNAADKNHFSAFTRLGVYLYQNYQIVQGEQKLRLLEYLRKGCEFLLPSCLKIQIYLQIMGDSSYQDYEAAYENMKQLFYLGSDCFRFDLVRLAKHFKDYSFLAMYCKYLKNIKEPNADICLGLLYEKGYGLNKDLESALNIYNEIKEKKQFDLKQNFDMPLSYRLGKVLHALGKTEEAQIQFKAIFSFYNRSKQSNLDMVCLYKIGKLYEKGLGCNPSIDQAQRVYLRIISDSNNEETIISRQTTAYASNLSNSLMNEDQLLGSRLMMNKPKKTEKIWERLTKNIDVKNRLNRWKQQIISPDIFPITSNFEIEGADLILPKITQAQSAENLPEIEDVAEEENSDEFSLIETTSQLDYVFDEFYKYPEKFTSNMLSLKNYCFLTASSIFSTSSS